MRIAISGYMGSGKTFLSKKFRDLRPSFTYIDLDLYSKKAMNNSEKIKSALKLNFGNIVTTNGSINFNKLSVKVFSTPDGIKVLNSVVHPEIIKLLTTDLTNKSKIIVDGAVIPLWSDLNENFDIKIWIDAPEKLRTERIKQKRNDLSYSDIAQRISIQYQTIPEPSSGWIKFNNSIETEPNGFIKLVTNGVPA